MDGYVDLPDDNDPSNDNGGVHINSGIPNRAFYLAATALGGYAWEKAGRVWYVTLTERLGSDRAVRRRGERHGRGRARPVRRRGRARGDERVDRGGRPVVKVSIIRGGGMAGIATRTQLASDALPTPRRASGWASSPSAVTPGRPRRRRATPTRRSTRSRSTASPPPTPRRRCPSRCAR